MMSNIKVIYFDSESIDSIMLTNLLSSCCISAYKVNSDFFIVKYLKSPKELYEELHSMIAGKNILITNIEISEGSYWGYMDKGLWVWLSENAHDL